MFGFYQISVTVNGGNTLHHEGRPPPTTGPWPAGPGR